MDNCSDPFSIRLCPSNTFVQNWNRKSVPFLKPKKMKKLLLFVALFSIGISSHAQITVTSSFVPLHVEGNSPTNNERVPFWFWAEISGLTPGATYRYYTAMDSLNASNTSNGAGNPYLINLVSGTVRRSTNASMTNSAGHDSLVASSSGVYQGWFGVEPTGNGRYIPGTVLYPKINMNNGAGGTTIATRVLLTNDPVKVLDIDTVSFSNVDGSALYDSVNAPAKNFVALYNNVTLPDRPLAIGIVEYEGVSQNPITSSAAFYRNLVDSVPGYYGTIIPNQNADGVRYVEVRDFTTGAPTALFSDDDGVWCSGLDTRDPNWGGTGMNLISTFTLTSSAAIPDSTFTSFNNTFTATSNDSNAIYSWDFGDASTGSGSPANHIYANPGTYMVQVIISNGGCSDTLFQSIVVELFTSLPFIPSLWFTLSPNPTDGEFMITTKDQNQKTVTVMNMLGEAVLRERVGSNTINLNLTGQEAGIYFIQIKDEVTGRIGTKKVVLQ
jgi:PKD domain/Secretion system C-terminal sorting domain